MNAGETDLRETRASTPLGKLAADVDRAAGPTTVEQTGTGTGRSGYPRRQLIVGDVLVMSAGLLITFLVLGLRLRNPWFASPMYLTLAAGCGMWSIRSQGLWSDRINAVRSVEISRITRAVVIFGLWLILLDRLGRTDFHIEELIGLCAVVWLGLIGWRAVFREWMTHQRRNGKFARQVVIVGADRRAIDLFNLFAVHAEAGMTVVGVIGDEGEARNLGLGALWLGPSEDAVDLLDRAEADTVLLCSTDLDPGLLNTLIRQERARNRPVLLDPGLAGIDFRSVHAWPVAHEPLLCIEQPALSRFDLACKRALDIVGASLALIVTLPVLAVVALLNKIEDGGPLFFHQQRVGLNGGEFRMHKLRTMAVDAEARLAELQANSERTGPLFKLDRDPRITRVGRFLRKSSLDEVAQLWNVLRGEMSLVGPRPALASEVAEFPDELHARHQVRPGVTGLWQVEARDNPSFEAYRRLDLFYVENWSLMLDLVIVLGTIEQLVMRPFRSRAMA